MKPHPSGLPEQRRLFLAVWPDPSTAESLAATARRIAATTQGRAMRADTLHLTLAFLGAVDGGQYARLQNLLREAKEEVWPPSFNLCLDRLKYWRHNGIVYVTGSRPSEELRCLAEALAELAQNSGIRMPERRFFPHLTLLRKVAVPMPELPDAGDGWTFGVDRFRLVESRLQPAGARYVTLGEWELATDSPHRIG